MTKVEEALTAIADKLAELFDTQAKHSEAIGRLAVAVSEAAKDIGKRLDEQAEVRNADVEKFNALTGRVDDFGRQLDDIQLNHMETTDALPLIRDRLAKIGLAPAPVEAQSPEPPEAPTEVSETQTEESDAPTVTNLTDGEKALAEVVDNCEADAAGTNPADEVLPIPFRGVRSSIYGG